MSEHEAEGILEQISGILDDHSMIATEKVYEIKDILHSEVVDGTPIRLDVAKRAVSA